MPPGTVQLKETRPGTWEVSSALLGRYEEARIQCDRYLALAQAIGDRRREAIAVGNLGNVLYDLGRNAEALACNVKAIALDREAGRRRGEAMSLVNLGNVLGVLGREDEGFAHGARPRRRPRD